MKPISSTIPKGQAVTIIANELHDSREEYYQNKMKSIEVKAPLPESFGFSVANEVTQSLSMRQIANTIVQQATPFLHLNLNKGYSERHYWRATEATEVTVELNFVSYYSGFVDVVRPIKELMLLGVPVGSDIAHQEEPRQFVAPDGFTGLFGNATAAVSQLVNAVSSYWNAPPKITVLFGDVLVFRNCWVKNVQCEFSNKLDDEFMPLQGKCTLTFMTEDPIGYSDLIQRKPDFNGFGTYLGKHEDI